MIIALCGQKGGAGKTTAAIALAAEWFRKGKQVLLVDADPQGSARVWGEVANEEGHKTPTIVSMGAGMHREEQLPKLVPGFDQVIIDCPPKHGEIQRSALMVADLALLPCAPSGLDSWALGDSIELVKKAQEVRPELIAFVLITRKVPRTVLGSKAREHLASCGLPLLKSELCFRVTYPEAISSGKGITVYAPKSPAADEVRGLVREVEALFRKEKARHAS